MECLICGDALEIFYKSVKDISVSSNNFIFPYGVTLLVCRKCRHLQKHPDMRILDELYSSYETDSILPNNEQIKFDVDIPKTTSYRLIENSLEFFSGSFLNKPLKMLDYGSGSGGMLHSFKDFFPGAEIYAYDVSKHNAALFEGIAKYFWTDFETIDERFDFISAVYCLEHIYDVKEVILKIRSLLNDDGILMVQVPNIEQNLWDIFVYDHIHHFSVDSLCSLLSSLGFDVIVPDRQIDRGITVIAQKTKITSCLNIHNHFTYSCDKLYKNLKILDVIVENKEKVGVFGSSINSTFIGGYLEESLEVFLDEDFRKIGKKHLGVKIISPRDYNGKVIMPYQSILDKMIVKYNFKNIVGIF